MGNSMDSENDKPSARVPDINGWPEIKGNPLSKVGVFPYYGRQISDKFNPDEIYNVYRPEEELSDPECLESFKLKPIVDDHEMLGGFNDGLTPPEEKGIHGVIGEEVFFEDGYLKGNLKIFSQKLSQLIENGKKELSIGYRCMYDLVSGLYNGIKYDAIQRNIRGNHLALVVEGRAGPDVAVLDHSNNFKFTFDSMELIKMPDKMEEKEVKTEKDAEGEGSGEGGALTLEAVANHVKSLEGIVKQLVSTLGAKKAADESEKEKETEDEDKDPDKDEKKGMDEKLIKKLTDRIESLVKDVNDIKKDGFKMMSRQTAERDHLAKSISEFAGVFDHKNMTVEEVAEYGVKKAGLKCKAGDEFAVLTGYLAGRTNAGGAGMAEDSGNSNGSNEIVCEGIRKMLGGK